jgi:hypothetical protein
VERSLPGAERGQNILYTAFTQRPKHLDPVQSYSEDEATFLYQIYEPPLQYHYLKRPFQLQVAAAERCRAAPVRCRRQAAAPGADPADRPQRIRDPIRPGIRYQPHPAFAADAAGKPLYLDLRCRSADKRSLAIFRRPAPASSPPRITSTRSSAWPTRACIRRCSS